MQDILLTENGIEIATSDDQHFVDMLVERPGTFPINPTIGVGLEDAINTHATLLSIKNAL